MWITEPEQSASWGIEQREHNNLTYMVKKERVKKKEKNGEKKEKEGVEEGKKREREKEN